MKFPSPDQVHTRLLALSWLASRPGLDHDRRAAALASTFDPDRPGQSALSPSEIVKGLAKGLDINTTRAATTRWVQQAESQARAWQERGVTALTPAECGLPSSESYAPLLSAWGDLSPLHHPKTAILNSRTPRRIGPRDRWLRRTVTLTEAEPLPASTAVVSGYGNYAYELSCFLAARRQAGLIVVCDQPLPMTAPDEIRQAFFDRYQPLFSPGGNLVISGLVPGRPPHRKTCLVRRDELVAALADALFGVEIRDKGHMVRLLEARLDHGADVAVLDTPVGERETSGNRKLLNRGARAVAIPNLSRPWPEPARRPSLSQNGGAQARPPVDRFLFHFTRACPGPWPGQDLHDYYRSLVNDEVDAGHTALDTLRRILLEKRIRANSRLIRGKSPAVSLTACPPDQLADLIHWRPALVRWTMEPFGVALFRKTAMAQGAEPVLYGDEKVWQRLPPDRRFLFQLHHTDRMDWTGEKEWRCPGDVLLDDLGLNELMVVVPADFRDQVREFFDGPLITV